MRYQVFNTRIHGAPVFSAPWKWVAYSYAAVMSNWWRWVDLIDAKTGDHVMGWVAAPGPLVLGGESGRNVSHVRIKADGSSHETVLGAILAGPSQTTIEGDGLVRQVAERQPLTVIASLGKPHVAGMPSDFVAFDPKAPGQDSQAKLDALLNELKQPQN